MKNSIGIIGGMGPMASQLFYKMVTEHTKASKDQEHINMIILSDASMPDRTSAILSGNYSGPHDQLLEDALLLQNSGCKAIGITCNTAHFFADMIADKLNIPIIHMIRETASQIAANCEVGSIVGVMATDGTIKTELYQKELNAAGLIPYTPDEAVQKEVMHQIYDCIKNGKPYDSKSWKIIEEAYRNADCSKVLLACTELSVIKADENLEDWFVDPMETLARRVIEFAGKEYI